MLLAQSSSIIDSLTDSPGRAIGILIVLAGVALGFKDLLRFSFTRVRAIARVCHTQSIRRRVLFITPLIIISVIVISQFQRADDAQDSIRQTTNACLFASGLLVTLVAIMIACTNIPREIENRVIYTVTTKPVTRLEIVLGKVLGFAAVSFEILLIMGMFTWGYLHWQDLRARQMLTEQMNAGLVPDVRRPTAQYYRQWGTLHSRIFGTPAQLMFLAAEPKQPGDDWIASSSEVGNGGSILMPFHIEGSAVKPPSEAPDQGALGPGISSAYPGGLMLAMKVQARRVPAPATRPGEDARPSGPEKARIAIDLRSADGQIAVPHAALAMIQNEGYLPSDTGGEVRAYISPENLSHWLAPNGPNDVYVAVTGLDSQHDYAIRPGDMVLFLPNNAHAPQESETFRPSGPPEYAGPTGQYGERLRGERGGAARAVAVYQFRNQKVPAGQTSCPFEFRAHTEYDSADFNAEDEGTVLSLTFRNRKTGKSVQDLKIYPENNRPTYFDVPVAGVAGGDFDVVIRCDSSTWITLTPGRTASLRLVQADQSFLWNLVKSMTVLWLMALLVTIASVFCSTFLSWPIAIILTLLILSGRWAVEQLGDMARPGIGNQIVTDLFRNSGAEVSHAVSTTVDQLARLMNATATVLPDLSKFAAMEEMNRGVAISPATLLNSLEVLLFYGIPMLVLGWIFLRYKEVAP